MKTKKIIFILVFFCFSLFVLSACNNSSNIDYQTIAINGHQLQIEIADTPIKQAHGLSDRQAMPFNHGMLFIFNDYLQPNFWMKDMYFPLDIIWIKDDVIVKINKNIPLENNKNLTKYNPRQLIDKVLEVNAGYTQKYNIKVGDKIKF